MKPTKYFASKSALTQAAKSHVKAHPLNWYVRTTLCCGHRAVQKTKAIILIEDERVAQRLVLCNSCSQYNENKKGGNHVQ